MTWRESTCCAGMPAARKAKLTIRLDSRSPKLEMASIDRGDSSPTIDKPFHQFVQLLEVLANVTVQLRGGGACQCKSLGQMMAAQLIDDAQALDRAGLPTLPWRPASSLFVVLPMAETTTTGCRRARAWTMQ